MPKKSSHKVLRFFASTTVLGAAAYAGGVYFAIQNDEFHDTFVQYVPFADQAIFRTETMLKLHPPEYGDSTDIVNLPHNAATSSVAPKGANAAKAQPSKDTLKEPTSGQDTRVKTVQPGSGVAIADVSNVSKSMEEVQKAKKEIMEHGAGATAKSIEGVEFVSAPMLDILDVDSTDPVVQSVINDLNKFIQQINEAKYSEESIKALQNAILNLNKQVAELRTEHDEQMNANKMKLYERFSEMHSNTLKEQLNLQRDALLESFDKSRAELEQAHAARLNKEVNANLSAVMQHADNLLVAGSIEAQRQFRDRIADLVENERNGRLAKIEELSSSVTELSQFAEKSGAMIGYSDNLAKFHIALAKMWSTLNSLDQATPLKPYIEEVRKYSVKNDPVVEAVLENIPEDAVEDGVLTHAQLAARFRLLVPELRKASLLPPNAGIAGHVGSWLFSMLMMPKSGNPKGDDVESIFARAETALSEGRIVDAIAEVNSLKGWPKKLASDWLNEGRKRGEVEFLLGLLSENATLSGLDSK